MIATTTLVQITIRSSQKNPHSSKNAAKKRFSKREVSAFKTVAIMQFGFTLTLSKQFVDYCYGITSIVV